MRFVWQAFAPHKMSIFSFGTWTMHATCANWTLPVSITTDWPDCMKPFANIEAVPFRVRPVFVIARRFRFSVSTKSKRNWCGGMIRLSIWSKNSSHWAMDLCEPSHCPSNASRMLMLSIWSNHSRAARPFPSHRKNWNYGEFEHHVSECNAKIRRFLTSINVSYLIHSRLDAIEISSEKLRKDKRS